MEASLVLVRDNGATQEVSLKKSRVIVGRQEDCQIRIPVGSVSRQHCEFQVDDGRLVLKDLGSSNGTFCNRRRVSQTELAAGDLISVGPCVFVVKVGGNPSRFDAAEAFKNGSVPIGNKHPSGVIPHPGRAPAVATPAGASPAAAKPAATKPAAPSKPAAPAKKAGEDDEFDPQATDTKDSSSEFDFDFLDDKDAPKL